MPEILELLDNSSRLDFLEEVTEELERACPDKFKEKPDKALEWLVEREQVLEACEDVMQKHFDGVPIKGALDDALVVLLAELDDLKAEAAYIEDKEASAETMSDAERLGLEYDL